MAAAKEGKYSIENIFSLTIVHKYSNIIVQREPQLQQTEIRWKGEESIMKSIIWKIELAAAVLLAISALVWGLLPPRVEQAAFTT